MSADRRRRHLLVTALLVVSALVLAACGGGGGGSGSAAAGSGKPSSETSQTTARAPAAGSGASTLHLEADKSGALRFNTSALQGRAGAVTLAMRNPAQLSHSIAIEGNGVNAAGPVVEAGGTSTVTASLKPGTYTFFCTVPGHRQAGMEGKLTIR